MERLLIEGGHRLEGTVQICGAKNASLPLIAASLLSRRAVDADEPALMSPTSGACSP